jgi:hypothetical protein
MLELQEAEMSVDDYIAKLKAQPKDWETTPEAFALVEEALKAYPGSARLWCFRGAFIQLGPAPEISGCTLQDALNSYRKAVEVEPDCPEGWVELGHYYDVILSDE